jgi:hypothetical protein
LRLKRFAFSCKLAFDPGKLIAQVFILGSQLAAISIPLQTLRRNRPDRSSSRIADERPEYAVQIEVDGPNRAKHLIKKSKINGVSQSALII